MDRDRLRSLLAGALDAAIESLADGLAQAFAGGPMTVSGRCSRQSG